jgi:hypothetical protein
MIFADSGKEATVAEARNGSHDDVREAKVLPAREALSLISTDDLDVGPEGEGVRADAGREPEPEGPAPDPRQGD